MERVSVCVAEVIYGEGGTRMYMNEAEKEFFWGSVSGSTGEAVGRMWVVQTGRYGWDVRDFDLECLCGFVCSCTYGG
jgi:hypothetical protein